MWLCWSSNHTPSDSLYLSIGLLWLAKLTKLALQSMIGVCVTEMLFFQNFVYIWSERVGSYQCFEVLNQRQLLRLILNNWRPNVSWFFYNCFIIRSWFEVMIFFLNLFWIRMYISSVILLFREYLNFRRILWLLVVWFELFFINLVNKLLSTRSFEWIYLETLFNDLFK